LVVGDDVRQHRRVGDDHRSERPLCRSATAVTSPTLPPERCSITSASVGDLAEPRKLIGQVLLERLSGRRSTSLQAGMHVVGKVTDQDVGMLA